MTYKIIDGCINCANCELTCPNQAISMGENIYVIDPRKCNECKGFHDKPQCVTGCPVKASVPDPDHVESEAELMAKASSN